MRLISYKKAGGNRQADADELREEEAAVGFGRADGRPNKPDEEGAVQGSAPPRAVPIRAGDDPGAAVKCASSKLHGRERNMRTKSIVPSPGPCTPLEGRRQAELPLCFGWSGFGIIKPP